MADEIISRKDARAQGLIYYFTGKPCPFGHITSRFVSSCGCGICVRIKGNARNLPGGSREPKGKSINAKAKLIARANGSIRYFIDEPCSLGHVAERYTSTGQCCACLSLWKRSWVEANRDKVNSQGCARRAANVQKYRDLNKVWRSTPHGRSVKLRIENKRRARKLGFSDHFTKEDVLRILAAQRNRCAYCRDNVKDSYEVDHIIPLSKGGSDDRRNIQIVCAPCNRKKQAKDPIKHARDLGLLI